MFRKTSAIAKNSYFKISSEWLPKDYQEEVLTLTSAQTDSLCRYDSPVYLKAISGISLLLVSRDLEAKPEKFVLHGNLKLEAGVFFSLLTMSDESTVSLAITPEAKKDQEKLKEPMVWLPHQVELDISSIYGLYYDAKKGPYQSKMEKHCFYELVVVEEGELETDIEGVKHKLGRYDAIIYSSNQEHRQQIASGQHASFITILFDMKVEDGQFFNRVFQLGTSQFSQLESFIRISEMEDYPYKNDQLLARLKLFILSLVSEFQPILTGVSAMKEKSDKESFQRILDYIKEHPEARVIDVSKAFRMSRSNIQALFHRFIHMQPRAYIEAQRLNQAKVLIRESSHSLTEISKLVGYHSLPAFSRSFKHAFGYPPSRYAKQVYKTI